MKAAAVTPEAVPMLTGWPEASVSSRNPAAGWTGSLTDAIAASNTETDGAGGVAVVTIARAGSVADVEPTVIKPAISCAPAIYHRWQTTAVEAGGAVDGRVGMRSLPRS